MTLSRRGFLSAAAAVAASGSCFRLSAADPQGEVPWLKEVQTPPATLPKNAPQLAPILQNAAGEPIQTLAAWKQQREALHQWWTDFLGPLDVERKPPKLHVVEEDKTDGVLRQRVRYHSEPDYLVEGYLLKPLEFSGKRPGVAVFHSTVNHTIRQPAGVQGKPEKAFGLKLAKRGYVTFCPRCFLWEGPGSIREQVNRFHKRHPGSKGMAKMLFDAQRAIDVLTSLPEVDETSLGAVGHSLGAKEVLYLAAFDPRVKVTVSSEGGIGTTFSNWHDPWYLGADIRQPDFAHDHHELLGLIAPRAFLLLGGDSADGARSWPYITSALPVYDLYNQPRRLGLYNHKQGHAVPPMAERRIYKWIETYLPVS